LKVASPLNDRIIAMTHSNCIYVDEQFFKEGMKENQNSQSYPVNVIAVRIGWIFKDAVGK
jgi:hypothetical protein